MEDQLAPHQYRCPSEDTECRVKTFMGTMEDGS